MITKKLMQEYIISLFYLLVRHIKMATTTTSPGKDFYLWENSTWLQDPKNSIPDEYSSWGSFVTLHDKSLKDQIKLLDSLKAKEYKNHNDKCRGKNAARQCG